MFCFVLFSFALLCVVQGCFVSFVVFHFVLVCIVLIKFIRFSFCLVLFRVASFCFVSFCVAVFCFDLFCVDLLFFALLSFALLCFVLSCFVLFHVVSLCYMLFRFVVPVWVFVVAYFDKSQWPEVSNSNFFLTCPNCFRNSHTILRLGREAFKEGHQRAPEIRPFTLPNSSLTDEMQKKKSSNLSHSGRYECGVEAFPCQVVYQAPQREVGGTWC